VGFSQNGEQILALPFQSLGFIVDGPSDCLVGRVSQSTLHTKVLELTENKSD